MELNVNFIPLFFPLPLKMHQIANMIMVIVIRQLVKCVFYISGSKIVLV